MGGFSRGSRIAYRGGIGGRVRCRSCQYRTVARIRTKSSHIGQLRLFDASLVGAAAARTAAARAKAPMPSPAVQRSAEPCALYSRLGHRLAEPRKGLKTRSLWMAKATGISAQPKMESFSTPHQMLGLSSRPNACVRIWRESLPIPSFRPNRPEILAEIPCRNERELSENRERWFSDTS